MRMLRFAAAAPAVVLVATTIAACGGGGSTDSAASSSTSAAGVYTSVNDDGLVSFDFKSNGVVTMAAPKMGASSTGSYTIDGEKLVVTLDGRQHTFVRDGKCIEEPQHIFGKLCQGGAAGAASNVSTKKAPVVTGTWAGSNADGDFKIDFKSATQLTFTGTMAGGGKTSSEDGTFVVEGDRVNVTLAQGMPLILQFVNDSYETTSLGLPLKFTRK
ncbi:MAG TPA: hypothetical protein VFV78_09910 [Vicinamibacterales bacterium]|nr:hypothetical protein [Vicinamibacterales bacterium]